MAAVQRLETALQEKASGKQGQRKPSDCHPRRKVDLASWLAQRWLLLVMAESRLMELLSSELCGPKEQMEALQKELAGMHGPIK